MSDAAEQLADHSAAAEPTTPREHDSIAPRITIDAFCVTREFASVLQSASADRRMAKTRVTIGMGGVEAAAHRYASVATPNLIIVESLESGFSLFGELQKLAEVVDEETHVVVAGPSNDVALYRELLRTGVSEYLVTPSSPLQAIEAIVGAYETPEAAPAASGFAVYGVRGGVGASTIAHNLADAMAEITEKETMLIDLDIAFGTAGLNFNVEAKSSVVDALSDVESLDDVKLGRLLHAESDRLKLLTAPASLRPFEKINEDTVLELIDVARHSCDLLVIDAPHGWSDAVRVALRQSTTPVLVAAPDLASLRNLKLVVDWLAAERPHDGAPRIVLNQTGQPKRPEIDEKEFVDIIGAEIDLILPWDPAAFGAAQNGGKMLGEISSGKAHSEALHGFTRRLLGDERRPPRNGGLLGWLSGLTRK